MLVLNLYLFTLILLQYPVIPHIDPEPLEPGVGLHLPLLTS